MRRISRIGKIVHVYTDNGEIKRKISFLRSYIFLFSFSSSMGSQEGGKRKYLKENEDESTME